MLLFEYNLAERLSWCCVSDMRAHLSGDEFAHWVGRAELRDEAQEAAIAKAKGQQPARPTRSRSFQHRR